MGGEGSGRKPDLTKQLLQPKTPVGVTNSGEPLFLPNYSGLSDASKKSTARTKQSDMNGAITFYSNAIVDDEYDARWKFESTIGQSTILIKGVNNAKLEMEDTSAQTDEKVWQLYCDDNGDFNIGAVSDSYTGQSIFFNATRSGTTVDTITINSNAVYLEQGIISSMTGLGTVTVGDWNGLYNGDTIYIDATSNMINVTTGVFAMGGSVGLDGATVVTSAGVKNIYHGIILQ